MTVSAGARLRRRGFDGSPGVLSRRRRRVFIGRVGTLLVGVATTAQLGSVVFAADPLFYLGWMVGLVMLLPRVVGHVVGAAVKEASPWL